MHAAPSLRPKDAAKDAAYLGDGEGQISQAAARTAADADHADRADRQGGGKTARLGPHHGEGRPEQSDSNLVSAGYHNAILRSRAQFTLRAGRFSAIDTEWYWFPIQAAHKL